MQWFLVWIVASVLVTQSLSFPTRRESLGCDYSKDELLLMERERAFRILLDLREEICPTSSSYRYPEKESMNENVAMQHNNAPDDGFRAESHPSWGNREDEDHLKNQIFSSSYELNTSGRNQNVFSHKQTTHAPSYSEVDLLNKLYVILGGDSWYQRDGWGDSSIPICQWFGVTCQPQNITEAGLGDFVSSIVLPGNNLSGDIEDASTIFSEFLFLKVLDLGYNSISGTLPDFKITHISELNLYANNIEGTIPNFSGIPNILYLSVNENHLVGNIPDFSAITKLKYIAIGAQKNVNGTIPNFSFLPNLNILGIYETNVSGTVPDFSHLNQIWELHLFSNELIGTVPNFSMIPTVTRINLFNNKLEGSIPDFNNLEKINEFSLSGNNINGTIPNFSGLQSVQVLYLYNNRLSGTIPNFTQMNSLKGLFAYGNMLQGTIPNFSNVPHMMYLDLSRNNLTGSLPVFSNMIFLNQFYAYANILSGSLPSFSSLPNIREVVVFRNRFSDSLPDLRLMALQKIDLSENNLSGMMPAFWETPLIQNIDISYNKIAGTVPKYVVELQQLKYFSISHNKFSGSLPLLFWNSPNLVSIDLSSNLFSGDVGLFISPVTPVVVYYMTYESLSLDDNYLTGEFNWRIYTFLTRIKSLSLRNNKITKLEELNSLLGWRQFDLTGNPITGHIPESYNRFSKLEYLGLKGTLMNHRPNNYLPKFVNFMEPFNLRQKNDSFICPSTTSKLGLVEMTVDLEPYYYNFALCQCLPNYFGFGENCIKCPPWCECTDGTSLKLCHASPNVFDMKHILYCPRAESCYTLIPNKFSNTSTLPNIEKYCETGYEGRACSKCQDGYGRQGNTCIKCHKGVIYSTIILSFVGFFSLLVYLYLSEASSSARLRIIMFHMQTMSIIYSGLSLPEGANSLIDISFSIGSIQPPNLVCVLGSTNQMDQLIFSYVRIPAFIFIGSVAYYFGSGRLQNKAVFITVNMLFFVYYSIAKDVFGIFGCTVYDEGEGAWFLHYSPWIQCKSASSEYRKLLGLTIPVFLFFLVGYPFFIWRKIREMTDKPGYDPKARYGFLFLPYKESYKYWEFVIIARRIAFSFVIGVIPYTQQPIFFLLLVVIIQSSIWMQNEYHPYNSKLENQMELSSLYVIFVSFSLALLSSFLGAKVWITVLLVVVNLLWWITAVTFAFILPMLKRGNPIKYAVKEMKRLSTSDPWFS